MVYHSGRLKNLGAVQLIIGTTMIVFGILNIFLVPYLSSYIGCGLWVGLWVGLTGLFGYLGARSNSGPNKCLIGTMIGFAVTSCVLSAVILIIYGYAMSVFAQRLRCPRKVNLTPPYRWDDKCSPINHYIDDLSYSKAQAGAGLGSILLILAVVEFFVAIASSIYGCNASCCTGTPGQTPGGVIVGNPTTGAAVAPGPSVQNFTTYPGEIQPQQGYIVASQGYPMQQHPPQGYPVQQHPSQGYPVQQHPPQGYPVQQHPPQGYPVQQHPPQGYPVQQHPSQGYPMQQYPAGVQAAGGGAADSQQPQQAFQNKQTEMPPPYNAAE